MRLRARLSSVGRAGAPPPQYIPRKFVRARFRLPPHLRASPKICEAEAPAPPTWGPPRKFVGPRLQLPPPGGLPENLWGRGSGSPPRSLPENLWGRGSSSLHLGASPKICEAEAPARPTPHRLSLSQPPNQPSPLCYLPTVPYSFRKNPNSIQTTLHIGFFQSR